jgi:hypothetical protein
VFCCMADLLASGVQLVDRSNRGNQPEVLGEQTGEGRLGGQVCHIQRRLPPRAGGCRPAGTLVSNCYGATVRPTAALRVIAPCTKPDNFMSWTATRTKLATAGGRPFGTPMPIGTLK